MDKCNDSFIYKGPWISAYLCSECGEYLSDAITESHWGKPCHGCGQVGDLVPGSIITSRRFVCTKKSFFGKETGHYEWSGKSKDGKHIPDNIIRGRKIFTTVPLIAASGIASGLF